MFVRLMRCSVRLAAYGCASFAAQRETHAAQHTTHNHLLNVLNYNFNKERYMLPEDDGVIETCRNVLNVLI